MSAQLPAPRTAWTVRLFWWAVPVGLALVGFLSVALTLDCADDCSWSADGPGLTFDEPFHVEVGVYLVESGIKAGIAALHPATWAEIYNAPGYNPDHPPLGRLGLGLAHAVVQRLSGTTDGRPFVVTYARIGSAVAYGLLLWLVSAWTMRYGRLAGFGAGVALLITPRVFAHAHLAALETWMNLTYTAFILVTAGSWDRYSSAGLSNGNPSQGRRELRARDGILPGILLGLALLTKMQAVVLPPLFVVWALWHWRVRALLPIAVAAVVSAGVFFAGWPWLWHDPLHRSLEYFARSTDRVTLNVYYLGRKYADAEAPWHYPVVMFLATTPVLLLILGGMGILPTRLFAAGDRKLVTGKPSTSLLLAGFAAPLVLFSLPGVRVYDGVRLFLVCWPLLTVFAGIGLERLVSYITSAGSSEVGADADSEPSRRLAFRSKAERVQRVLVGGVLCVGTLFPVWSIVSLHPCQLSYYSEWLGGLRGASRLGMETTYWGDSVTPEFLRRTAPHLPEGARLAIAPVLHPLTLEFMRRQTWLRHRPDLKWEAYDDSRPETSRSVIVIRRHADPWDSLSPPPTGTKTEEEVRRQGAVLTEFLELP